MFFLKIIVSLIIAAIFVVPAIRNLRPSAIGEVNPRMRRGIGQIALMLFAIILFNESIGAVPAGHRGVVLRFGAVTGAVKSEGIYTVTPFIQSVVLMDCQVHAHATKASAASKDLQDVAAEVTLNYQLDPATVAETYRDLRHDYETRIIVPTIQEAVKATTAGFDAEELIVKRPMVRDSIESALRERLSKHGILFDQMSITDFDFSREFTAAIEAKVVAVQRAQQAENDLHRIQIEAQQNIARSQGEAEAIRIQAESISKQGGAEYVRMKAVEKWNGVLPTYNGSGAVPFINING